MKIPKPGLPYLENLDALRFLAFFAVFIHHIFSVIAFKSNDPNVTKFISRFLMNGQLGVSFFFVLSGFLITHLLLKEKEYHNKINIAHFYMRRTLRIWPLYFFILFIGFCIIPYFTKYQGGQEIQKNLYVFFLGNFDLVRNGIGHFITSVLWSISIEEQFYLIWPVFVGAIPLKHFTKFLILIILFSVWYRIFGQSGKSFHLKLSYHTFSCVFNLAIGGLLAHLMNQESLLKKIKELSRYSIFAIYTVGWLVLFLREDILRSGTPGSPYLLSIFPVFYAIFFAFIIAEQVYCKNSFFKIGRIILLNKMGKISYGLYCYHMLAIFIVFQILTKFKFNTAHPGTALFTVEALASFALTILLSYLSFHFFEKKFLSYKTRFSPVSQGKPIR